jgi:Domain of unknown function (DUF397)
VELHGAQGQWRRSTRCSTGACVEVAEGVDAVLVRDSKQPEGGNLQIDHVAWMSFIAAISAGEIGRS